MIIEKLPAVQRLSPEEKRQLARELWDEVLPPAAFTSEDSALLRMLETRYAEFKAGRDTAAGWDEVRRRLNAACQCMRS